MCSAKVSGPSSLFDWNDTTLPAGVVFDHYQIQIATDNGFTAIVYDNNVSGITNSQDNTAILLPANTYYWRFQCSQSHKRMVNSAKCKDHVRRSNAHSARHRLDN